MTTTRGTEAAPFEWADALRRSHMALNTTVRCQQRCVYCFEGDRHGREDIDVETVRAHLRATRERCDGVVFMGAEPTLTPHILDHIAYARRLGLHVMLSTNALRFRSRRFLDACVAADLDGMETSFSAPDEEVFSAITRLPRSAWRTLRQAHSNIAAHNAEARAAGGQGLFVGTVTVVSQFNYRRLREVVERALESLGDSLQVVGFKAVCPWSDAPAATALYRDRIFVPLQLLREAFTDLLSRDWGVPLYFRGFPLCTLPGFEELAANLHYHWRGPQESVVIENIHDQTDVRRMHEWAVSTRADAVRPECRDCGLERLCLDRFLLGVHDGPLNAPVPTARPVADLAEALGWSEAVQRAIAETPRAWERGLDAGCAGCD
jgi:MoaA/NifB/PqqE/SkfB family radical SAM enzyme